MSYLRIWRYQVTPGRENDFHQAYGPNGDWTRLFARADGYLGTELFHSVDSLTPFFYNIDRWRSAADWQRFLSTHRAAYDELDRRLAPLCIEDIEVAAFTADFDDIRG